MSATVCLAAEGLFYPEGGSHLWVYLNWALGLRELGCRVIWLEPQVPEGEGDVAAAAHRLENKLKPLGLTDGVVVPGAPDAGSAGLTMDEVVEISDLLLNPTYVVPAALVRRFSRSALLDIDPGQTQLWSQTGQIALPPHDVYFSISETIGTSAARFPDLGLEWHYTPPCVATSAWATAPTTAGAPYTTVSHWWADDWFEVDGAWVENSKRAAFQDYLDVPSAVDDQLELALGGLGDDDHERAELERRGWRLRDAWQVAADAAAFRRYVRSSRGEWSCAKPHYVRLETGWLSDRTVCYLASAKPAIVQRTSARSAFPDGEGLLRFATPQEATEALRAVALDYDGHCAAARQLAEAHFAADVVARRLLETALA